MSSRSLVSRFVDKSLSFARRKVHAMIPDVAPPIEVVDDLTLRESPRESLNRLCNIVDWQVGGELTRTMGELRDPVTVHRKAWEYAMCVHGLRKLGVVTPESQALGVGAGHERPIFYFANHCKRVVATDLYSDPDHEGKPEMLTHPEKFAPFPFRRECLDIKKMSGDDLKFNDNSFDLVFCLSSIEHFGSRETQRKSLAEMRRVLRPGGVIALATELILNKATHREYFTYAEVDDIFLHAPGLELVGGPLDLRIAESLVRYPVLLGKTKNLLAAPHIVLLAEDVMFTSVMLFLRKTG